MGDGLNTTYEFAAIIKGENDSIVQAASNISKFLILVFSLSEAWEYMWSSSPRRWLLLTIGTLNLVSSRLLERWRLDMTHQLQLSERAVTKSSYIRAPITICGSFSPPKH